MNEEEKRQLEELTEGIKNLSERQNSQYTDIMLILKGIEEKLRLSEVKVRNDDELYEDAKEAVIEMQSASTSYLQRVLGIGYSRAAQMMDLLEANGVIGEANGSKPRKVLIEE